MTTNESLNRLVMRIALRAEMLSEEMAETAFVELDQVTDGLRRIDHQIVYGRRGAGKTHAFRNLSMTVGREGDLPVYIDLRTIGSSGGLYGDTSQSLAVRGTQLLIDVLEACHVKLLDRAIDGDSFEGLLEHLDDVANAASQVRVEGPVTVTSEFSEDTEENHDSGLSGRAKAGATGVWAELDGRRGRRSALRDSKKHAFHRSGHEVPRVLFGRLSRTISNAAAAIAPRRIWILLDEWSSLPLDLQPLLADMLRRALFTCPGITVKIGAIERRSSFTIAGSNKANYIGIELGADTAAALNLDAYLVGGRQEQSQFFTELLYRHLVAFYGHLNHAFVIRDSADLSQKMFGPGALAEYVRAAEGVPRDALQIAYHAAQHAARNPITVEHVQMAARRHYLQDKETGIAGKAEATKVWAKLQRDVVSRRRSRTFLIKRDRERTHSGILDLYDARLIHLLEPGLVTRGDPGVLYDGYCLDYGSYVNMLHKAELSAAWDSSMRLWEYRRGEAFLPDVFGESAVFSPTDLAQSAGGRGRR